MNNKIESMKKWSIEIDKMRGSSHPMSEYQTVILSNDGNEIAVDILEAKEAKAVIVFMPGTNAYTYLYNDYLFALFNLGYHVVAFDPRGHGKSGGRPGGYSIEELLSDFTCVAEYTKKRFQLPLFVSGSSQGGITAFYYLLKDQSVSGGICHNLADLSDPRSVELIRYPRLGKWLRPLSLLIPKLKFFEKIPVAMCLYLDLKNEPVKGFKNAKQVLYENPFLHPYVSLKTLMSLGNTSPPKPMSESQVPLFVIQAGGDNIFRTNYIEYILSKYLGEKKIKIYPGLPHYMIVDYVDQFINDVDDWIKLQLKRSRGFKNE